MKALFDFSLGKNFWLFRIGQFTSVIGSICSRLALSYWVVKFSPQELASLFTLGMVIEMVLIPLIGPLGDRVSRKKLMVYSEILQTLIMSIYAVFVFNNYYNFVSVLILYGLYRCVWCLYITGSSGLNALLLPKEKYEVGMRQTQILSNVALIAGGVMGALIIEYANLMWAFCLDICSFLISIAINLLIQIRNHKPIVAPESGQLKRSKYGFKNWIRDFKEGLVFILGHAGLLFFVIAFALANAVESSYELAMIALIGQSNDLPPWLLGHFHSVQALGGVLGLFAMGIFNKNRESEDSTSSLSTYQRVKQFLFFSLSVSFSFLFIGFNQSMLTLIILPFIIGMGIDVIFTIAMTEILILAPDQLKSRIFSIMNTSMRGVCTLSTLATGYFLKYFKITTSFYVMGLICILISIAILKRMFHTSSEINKREIVDLVSS